MIQGVFLNCCPDCPSCLVHLNSNNWATWAIWAAIKKYSLKYQGFVHLYFQKNFESLALEQSKYTRPLLVVFYHRHLKESAGHVSAIESTKRELQDIHADCRFGVLDLSQPGVMEGRKNKNLKMLWKQNCSYSYTTATVMACLRLFIFVNTNTHCISCCY